VRDDHGGPDGQVLGRPGPRESVRTWANLATAVRTAIAVPLALAATVHASAALLVAGYLVYWLGDIADGALARRVGQETRIGAVLDIVSDRACGALLAVGLATLRPQLWPALAIFLLQFMVLDSALSLSFLRWPILGPNDFHRVDRTIFRYNWSKLAKALNTTGVIVAAATGQPVPALVIAVAQLAVKAWSTRRLLALTA
jgi:CDP-diacylglycerol--glycerol-3-phosphate 3-phosphatidyltransferase